MKNQEKFNSSVKKEIDSSLNKTTEIAINKIKNEIEKLENDIEIAELNKELCLKNTDILGVSQENRAIEKCRLEIHEYKNMLDNLEEVKVMERDQYENFNNKINLHYKICLKDKLEELKEQLSSLEYIFDELESIKFFESIITQYLYTVSEARKNNYMDIKKVNIDMGMLTDYRRLIRRIDNILSKFNV